MLDSFAPVLILVLGLLMLFIEVTVVAGFGVIGIAGLGLIGWGSFAAWTTYGPLWGVTLVAGSLAVTGLLVWLFFRSRGAKALIRVEKIDGSSSEVANLTHLVGRRGLAVSDLRPSGIAQIEGIRYDVLSDGGFVAKDSAIEVKSIGTNSILVSAVRPEPEHEGGVNV